MEKKNPTAIRCPECGQEVILQEFCPNCGHKLVRGYEQVDEIVAAMHQKKESSSVLHYGEEEGPLPVIMENDLVYFDGKTYKMCDALFERISREDPEFAQKVKQLAANVIIGGKANDGYFEPADFTPMTKNGVEFKKN